MVECCGNCHFYREGYGYALRVCKRFPKENKSRIDEDDWCGEWQSAHFTAK